MLYLVYNKWGLGVSDGRGSFLSLEDANKQFPTEVKALLASGGVDECEIINERCYVGEKKFEFIINAGVSYPDEYTVQYVEEVAAKFGGVKIGKQFGDITFATYDKACFDDLAKSVAAAHREWTIATIMKSEPTVTITEEQESVEEIALGEPTVVIEEDELLEEDDVEEPKPEVEEEEPEELGNPTVIEEEDEVEELGEPDVVVEDEEEIPLHTLPTPDQAVCNSKAIEEDDGFDMDVMMEMVSNSFEEEDDVIEDEVEEDIALGNPDVVVEEDEDEVGEEDEVEEEEADAAVDVEIVDVDELDDKEPYRETVLENNLDRTLAPYTKTIVPADCKGETFAFTYDYVKVEDVNGTAYCIENNFERRGDYWILDVIQRGMRIIYSEKNQYKHEFRIDDCL